MAHERKKVGVAFWVTVATFVLLAYPLSFGPACWLCHKRYVPVEIVSILYRPVVWAAWHGPRQTRLLISRFEAICQGRNADSAGRYFEFQEKYARELKRFGPPWPGHISINMGYGNFDDFATGDSPIQNAAPDPFADSPIFGSIVPAAP